MDQYPQVIYRKHTFLSALVTAASVIAVMLIASCTALILYTMRLAAADQGRLLSFAQQAVHWVPPLSRVVPPSFTNSPVGSRQPDYCSHLILASETKPVSAGGPDVKTIVRIINQGDQTVSLLSLRIVILGSRREVLAESTQWAATPVAAHPQWQGPLLAGCQRYIAVPPVHIFPAFSPENLRTEVEIADIRTVSNGSAMQLAGSQPTATKQ